METREINNIVSLLLVFCLLLSCGAVADQNGRQPEGIGNGGSQACDPLLQYLFGTCGRWPFPASPLPIFFVPSPPPPRQLSRPPRHVVLPPQHTVSPQRSPPSPLHVPSPPYVPLPPSMPLLPYLSPPLSRSSMGSAPPPPYVPLPPLPRMPFLANIPPPPLPDALPTASPPPPPYVTLPPSPMSLLPNFSPVWRNFPSGLPPRFPGPAFRTVPVPSLNP